MSHVVVFVIARSVSLASCSRRKILQEADPRILHCLNSSSRVFVIKVRW